MSDSSSVGSLTSAALARKQKLAALRKKKENKDRDNEGDNKEQDEALPK